MKIECPKCGFSREVDADKIPDKAKLATCPKCGHKFHFRNAEDEFEIEDDHVQSEAGTQDQTGAAEQEDIWSKLESLDEDAA